MPLEEKFTIKAYLCETVTPDSYTSSPNKKNSGLSCKVNLVKEDTGNINKMLSTMSLVRRNNKYYFDTEKEARNVLQKEINKHEHSEYTYIFEITKVWINLTD